MGSKKEELLYKSEGVRDCVKWLEQELKKQEKNVEGAEKNELDFGMYDDCGESYRHELIRQKQQMETMVNIKVSLEKYMKKLKHEVDEVNE
jgi:hypothetical protein